MNTCGGRAIAPTAGRSGVAARGDPVIGLAKRFRLERQESHGRNIRYTTRSYAVDRPEGRRYGGQ